MVNRWRLMNSKNGHSGIVILHGSAVASKLIMIFVHFLLPNMYDYRTLLLTNELGAPEMNAVVKKLEDLKPGMIISLTACNGTWTVVGVRDWHAIKVQPENLNEDPIWVDSDEITALHT